MRNWPKREWPGQLNQPVHRNGATSPFHLPERRTRPPRLPRVRGVLQPREALASDRSDSGSISRASNLTAHGGEAGRSTSSRRTRARLSAGGVSRFANMAVFVNWTRVGGAGLIFIPPSLSPSSLLAGIFTLFPGSNRSTGTGRYGPIRTASRPSLADEISAE